MGARDQTRYGLVCFTLDASDQQNGSGVSGMQIGLRSDLLGAPWVPYTSIVNVDAPPGATVYARVRDGVGNRSATVSVMVPLPTATPTGTVLPPTVTPTGTPTGVPASSRLFLPVVRRG